YVSLTPCFSCSSHLTSTPELYTLSLHDALPIWISTSRFWSGRPSHDCGRLLPASHSPARCKAAPGRVLSRGRSLRLRPLPASFPDRKSTRLNSSHLVISYAVFCLKKKTIIPITA